MVLFAASATGCGTIIEKEEVEELIPEYTLEELPSGIFIKAGDVFYAPSNGNKTYKSLPENTSPDRILWYTDGKERVPGYMNGNQIVYKDTKMIPKQFVIEGFEHICDSIGVRGIRLNDAGRYVISGDANFHQTSDAFLKLSQHLKQGTIILDNINGNSIQNRMLNKTGSLSGLEKGKSYIIGFYIGTQYYEEEVFADTEIYASKSIHTITNFDMTKNGYLVLQMPELLTPGLYDLNNMGIVNYSGVIQN